MYRLLDRTTQLTNFKWETPGFGPLTYETALKTVALAATLLFAHGQTTERTVTSAERLGRALGVTVRVLPYWGEITVELDGAPLSEIVPAKPLSVDMGRVLAVTAVIDQICHGTLPAEHAQSALESAGRLPPTSTPRYTLSAAIGAVGTLDATSLLLIAASAAIGALARRLLSGFSNNPLIQPLCAAFIAGVVAAAASRFQLSVATALVAFCPCMVLVPGPHILNGAIDLARTRIALGIARLAYAGVIVLLICAGKVAGFTAAGGDLAIAESVSALTTAPRREWRQVAPSPPSVLSSQCRGVCWCSRLSSASSRMPHAGRCCPSAPEPLPSGALLACMLVSVITAPVVDRHLHLPFAAVAFSAVVSLMPGFSCSTLRRGSSSWSGSVRTPRQLS